MAESLTTEEMDTLLEGVSAEDAERAAAAGESAAAGPDAAAGIRPYDLGSDARAPLRLPMLEALNERVARELGDAFEAVLDRPHYLSERSLYERVDHAAAQSRFSGRTSAGI